MNCLLQLIVLKTLTYALKENFKLFIISVSCLRHDVSKYILWIDMLWIINHNVVAQARNPSAHRTILRTELPNSRDIGICIARNG